MVCSARNIIIMKPQTNVNHFSKMPPIFLYFWRKGGRIRVPTLMNKTFYYNPTIFQ